MARDGPECEEGEGGCEEVALREGKGVEGEGKGNRGGVCGVQEKPPGLVAPGCEEVVARVEDEAVDIWGEGG